MKQVFILIIHTTYYQRVLTYLIPIFLGLTLANSQKENIYSANNTSHRYVL